MEEESFCSKDLVLFTRQDYCPHCQDIKNILKELDFEYTEVDATAVRSLFVMRHKTVPQVYYKGRCIGDAYNLRLIFTTYPKWEARRIIMKGMHG